MHNHYSEMLCHKVSSGAEWSLSCLKMSGSSLVGLLRLYGWFLEDLTNFLKVYGRSLWHIGKVFIVHIEGAWVGQCEKLVFNKK